ncbi:MAG: hypothetical protein V1729_00400 [Candidatus Woesearchaeota archaeon]
MTICIGLIPNEKTVMLIQDSEVSYQQLGFTQDIIHKMRDISKNAITGIIGDPTAASEIIEMLKAQPEYKNSKELKNFAEESYHRVREEKLLNGILRTYGFKHIREVTQPQKELPIDPEVRSNILNKATNHQGFSLELMLASNIDKPQLCTITFPGTGIVHDSVKMYAVSGSGTIMAIDKMGEELERYKWHKELTTNEGIEVLMRAGKASEKHTGVGGPFSIAYLTKEDEKTYIVKPDQKKINMVMYLFPLKVTDQTMKGCIERLRDDKVTAEDMSCYIKENTGVGIEFDHYFGLD